MPALGPWPHGDPMPLTPQERERLAEIEAGLRTDPDFVLATGPRGNTRPSRHRTVATALIVIGFALATTGAAMAPRAFVVGGIVILVGFLTVVGGAVTWLVAGEGRSR